MNHLIYPELSYQIVGELFRVQKELGKGYREKHVQRAVAIALQQSGLQFREQQGCQMNFGKGIIGRYYLDFVVEDKIAIELKVRDRPLKKDYDQIKSYLEQTGLLLGLLAYFGQNGVIVRRVLKPKVESK